MLYPLFAMFLLTLVVAMVMLKRRIGAAKAGTIRFSYFKVMQGQEIPEKVLQAGRQYQNLFEMPVLFYLVGVLYMLLNMESLLAVALAWGFVGFRVVHTLIHLSYNHVMHRLLAFLASVIVLTVLWGMLIWQYGAAMQSVPGLG
ncbi:MAPEG family protein [Bowmanella dokdonensis]|uniref:MAPEG family protein n=1 Tax=Bowmanella dokdonensis TaxID=751969 RepID=A0A939ISH6_9ALTE|nr:MAPEG family protein [Bowmanella dokdonensis]MBN7827204.1 MAPEG family protein [Bowmanella dokdonensis]